MRTLTTVVAAVTFLACAPTLAQSRLADISVYDRTEGRWLQVYRHEGKRYLAGKPGHEYHIRIASRLREDVLAIREERLADRQRELGVYVSQIQGSIESHLAAG